MVEVAELTTKTARPSMKERQWQLREEAILDAATDLLKTKGFIAMTLEDITEAIGISRPTLYQHFKSKEHVATKVAIRNLCTVYRIYESLDLSLTAGQRLRSFLKQAVDMRFDPTRIPMYDVTRIKLSQACYNSELRAYEVKLLNKVTDLIREAQATNEVRNDIRAEVLVLVATGLLKNLELDASVQDGITTPAEIEQSLEILFFGSD